MRNLETLIKLQKTKVDEQRVVLAKIQKQLDDVIATIFSIEEEKKMQEELLHEMPDLSMTYGDYMEHFLEVKKQLEKQKDALSYTMELARDQLAELFEEQKRYEISLQNKLDEIEQERKRRERLELDELGGIAHERRKKQRKAS